MAVITMSSCSASTISYLVYQRLCMGRRVLRKRLLNFNDLGGQFPVSFVVI
jgi:hypothetical protein